MPPRRRKQKSKFEKKIKTRPSQEYIKNEIEISSLLDKSHKQTTIQDQNDNKLQDELDFFGEGLSKQLTIKKLASSDNDSSIDGQEIDEEKSDNDNKSKTKAIASLLETPRTQPASSYIQIEDILSPIQRVKSTKIHLRDDLFYLPSCKETTDLPNFEEKSQHELLEKHGLYIDKISKSKDANTIRMINRYAEEKHFNLILSPNSLKYHQQYTKYSSKLYRTICEKKFAPFLTVFSLTAPIYQQGQHYMSMSSKKHLTIIFKELQFLEHPLQNEEHKLAIKLENALEAYTDKLNMNCIEKLSAELDAVREIVQNMLDEAKEDNLNALENYIQHTKYLRTTLHQEELTMKSLLKIILDTWLKLKNLRQKQGINFTNIKLLIQIEETDVEADELQWEKRYQTELNEILREEFEIYYREKRNRKKHQQQRDFEIDELEVNNLEKSIKPLKPLHKPDAEIIKTKVHEILVKCTRLPGEPKIKLNKTYIKDKPKGLDRIKEYFFKIYFDGKLLGSTKIFKLHTGFKLDLNESIAVYLNRKLPENIKIELYEKTKIHSIDNKITSMFLPLLRLINYSLGSTEVIEFSSKKYNISGKLTVIVHLSTKNCPNIEEDDIHDIELSFPTQTKISNIKINKTTVDRWYENELINPLDPDCMQLVKRNLNEPEQESNVVNDENNVTDVENDIGKCVFKEELLTFCSETELLNNLRLKMLMLRHKNDMKYKDFRFIPIFDNEIQEQSDEEKVLETGNWMNIIDLQRHEGKKYINKLYEVILNHCNLLNTSEESSKLLTDVKMPSLISIFQSIMDLFFPNKSPLTIVSPPKTELISVNSTDLCKFNVIVNVVRATGIPVRSFQTTEKRLSSSNASMSYHNFKYSNVRPCVIVTYRNQSLRTTTADGSSPTWNEQLILQISGKPLEFRDEIKFLLFDEYIEDLLNDDTTRGMEVYQRIHMNWLGELRIPLSTIFQRHTIEGVFEMNSPKVILGYNRPSLNDNSSIQLENPPQIKDSVYLSLYINIEPQFELSTVSTSGLECSELKEVQLHIRNWSFDVRENYPDHYINPLISLSNGKRVCITRLLEPIPLPFDNDTENLRELLKRYVSLIPILRGINPCMGLKGIWLNNQLILDTSWASPKDLGILLACFYLTTGYRAFCVLGIGIPYGDTTFVLVREVTTWILIDPCTGKSYTIGDVNCPLQKIFCIVSLDNVYLNIQMNLQASLIDFNFNNTSNWLPLFGRNNPAPIGGVHKLNYKYISSNVKILQQNIVELRKNIERKIIKKINSWRSNRKTIWNRAISDVLYNVLCDLEIDVTLERTNDQYSEQICREIQTHKLFGFTLNFSYTNLSSIAERIKSTGIHLTTDRNVEFSVAVHVKQYPNNILSIWIFLVSAVPY